MTMNEYEIRITAYELSRLNRSREIHEQAWANAQVKAEKTIGKKTVPVYKTFDKFFDYKKAEEEILGTQKPKNDNSELQDLLLKANS